VLIPGIFSRVWDILLQRDPGTPVKNSLLGNSMNQLELNEYFSTKWEGNFDQYIYSGWNLVEKVYDHEWILDVGCGKNPFKGKIKNLIGIDPAFDEADYKVILTDFKPNLKFDVAFCLGSINFGPEDKILSEIDYLINLLKPSSRIYWRCNPGKKDHGNKECQNIMFFNWSFDTHLRFSKYFGFTCAALKYDKNNRIYSEWVR
jgi:hypothetical protein